MTALWVGLAVVAGFGLLLAVWVVVPQLALRRNRRELQSRCSAGRAIAITFDDGPGRDLTPRVLERLHAHGVTATFFVLGRHARENPDLLAAIRAAGHELGCHGDAHVHHLKSPPAAGRNDTVAAWQALRADHGLDGAALPFRPPYGKLNLWSWWFVRRHRAPIAMWTHDGWDTRPDIDRGAAALVTDLRASRGGVVLLHDFDRTTEGDVCERSAADVIVRLDAVLALAAEGYEFVTISELLAGPTIA
ncbi:MAG: polysaccharide deacetylase family protein [bacterium]|nr:polysaccharide deacetylase family protein [bacterium]